MILGQKGVEIHVVFFMSRNFYASFLLNRDIQEKGLIWKDPSKYGVRVKEMKLDEGLLVTYIFNFWNNQTVIWLQE